jgi:hypothetical protein
VSCEQCGGDCPECSSCFDHVPGCSAIELPTVAEVCVIEGPGRGECWGCPVRDCVLWQNPLNPLSEETQAVALKAAHKLASREKAISPFTQDAQKNLVDMAELLAVNVTEPGVAAALVVQMAAEAVLQNIVRDVVIKRQRQYTDRWWKGLKGRSPTQDDDADLDELMYKAEADAAAEAYECDASAVLVQLAYYRNRRIVRRDRE